MFDRFDPLAVDVPRLLQGLGISAEHVGDRWVAKCPHPDHVDKTPSWDMKDAPGTERHGLHKCLSCQWRGTATECVSDLLGITFSGARAWILEHAMGSMPITERLLVDVRPAGTGFQLPREVVLAPMEEWPTPARAYMAARRIAPQHAAAWRLGYAVSGRLAGRIVLPVRDARGTLTNYTARSFAGSAKKYLEPKRDEGAKDGAIFGEELWPPLGQRDIVVVTEGGFNALAAQRVADVPVGALFGSSIMIEHLTKLGTFRRALLLTDPDLAGDRAAEKIMQACGRHLEMERAVLERGKDADATDPGVLRIALEVAMRKLAARGIRKWEI